MQMSVVALTTGAVLLMSTAPLRAEVELKNDSFVDGNMVAVQGGFAATEIAAARFNVTSPRQLLKVRLIFANQGAGGAARDVTLHVWSDSQNGNDPGAELFSGDFTLMPSQTAMQELNVAGDNVMVGGYFRVGIEVHHAGPPSVVNDVDGFSVVAGSLLKSTQLGWAPAQFYGVSGDWVLRAVVSDGGGGTPDAGVTIDASMGGPDANMGGPDGGGSGGACTGNGDCEIGEYCDPDLRACTFDCRHDSDCPGNDECNSLGQCVGAEDGGGGCCEASGGSGAGGALGALGLAGLVGLVATRRRRGASSRRA